MKTQNKENAIKRMQEAVELSKSDPEVAHVKADQAMADLLKSLGYEEVVELFERVTRWCA